MMAWRIIRWCMRILGSKTGRMVIMLILTVGIAFAEIIYGIRSASQLLIADGLFSFAEGFALVGSLLALRYAKAERLHSKNTFGWARLELLAGLLQEVLLLSLSLSIIVDSINKLINPNHIENPSAMIYLGSAGAVIGLLGLFLFRGYHHDHDIGEEIVEQKKNDFVRSVFNTLHHLDNNGVPNVSRDSGVQRPLLETSLTSPTPDNTINVIPELVITGSTSTINDQRKQRQQPQHILPSLNDTYTNAFVVADNSDFNRRVSTSVGEQQLRVPDRTSLAFSRMRSVSGDSMMSSALGLADDPLQLDDEFAGSRVYATLHALCLHSLAVLLESFIVLLSGLLNKFVPSKDRSTGEPINQWLKYIDPSLTLIMVVIIAAKAIPVCWSLGQILVEAVPAGINTHQLIKTIIKTIPEIRAVHSVHVWRATARDVFATLHVVCDKDLSLSTCTDGFGRQLQRIFETHCIRHFTLQYEYVGPGGNVNRCAYGTRRRQRGHQSASEENTDMVRSQMNLRVASFDSIASNTDPSRRSV